MTHRVSRAILRRGGQLSAAGLFAFGCSNVLGIHDPVLRAPDAGGGEAGATPLNAPIAGAAPGGAAGSAESGAPGDAGLGAMNQGGDAEGGGDVPSGGAGTAGAGTGGASGGGGGGTGGGGTGGADTGGGGTGGADSGGGGTGGGGTGGTGGTGGAPACVAESLRCDPASPKTPQVCSAGQWINNPAQNNGQDCPVACNAGVCGECSNGDVSCKDNYPRSCVNGAWVKAPNSCPDVCAKGACVNDASCAGVVAPSCNQESCCLSLEVTGSSFNRDNKATFPATVSSFSMDKYEVTVARLKKYIDWYFGPEGGPPAVGAGKSPHFAPDPGWLANYTLPARTPAGMQDMQDMLGCVVTHGDPIDANATYFGQDPLLPANCVSFYVAQAMCIWDGGRLPTEAEWYLAAASAEQRVYPWSTPANSTLIDSTYAVYAGTAPKAVGTLPMGHGFFGQLDLAGNVNEWTLDYYANPYPTAIAAQCNDCINTAVNSARSVRGGSFQGNAPVLKTSFRTSLSLDSTVVNVGFRCVHDL